MSRNKANQFQDNAVKTACRTVEMHGLHATLDMNALGLGGESGEFIDNVKKIVYHGHELTPELRLKMKKELGDILWYVANASKALGYTLEEVMDANADKLQKRYPEGKFSTERSKNRTDSEEDRDGHLVFNRAAADAAIEKVLNGD